MKWYEGIDGRQQSRIRCRGWGMLSVIPVMTSMQVIARKLGIDFDTRGDCHTTLVTTPSQDRAMTCHYELTTMDDMIANGTSLNRSGMSKCEGPSKYTDHRGRGRRERFLRIRPSFEWLSRGTDSPVGKMLLELDPWHDDATDLNIT
jgi:hypothetical protein